MKKAMIFASLLLLCAAGAAAFGAPASDDEAQAIPVSVDPRIELLSIVNRLAGAEEYSQGKVPSYVADVDRHFGRFKDHPAVVEARRLRESAGISFNAPMGLAVLLTDAESLGERVPLDPIPADLDARWKTDDARAFIGHLRAFVRDTEFRSFFESHRALYRTAVERMSGILAEERIVEWFGAFFGKRDNAAFTIYLALLNGGANYGARVRLPDGREDLYSIMGVWRADQEGLPSFSKTSVIMTVVHEFCHSYANPIVDANADKLEASGQALFEAMAEDMKKQAYGNGRVVLCESLVRASVIRYYHARRGPELAAEWVESETDRGFLWIGDLAGVLGDYEKRRDEYPSFESMIPRIAALLADYAGRIDGEILKRKEVLRRRREELAAKSPKIVSLVPADGAQDVDPGLQAIVITFDRPMNVQNMAFMQLDPATAPKLTGKAAFDASGKIMTIPVELVAEKAYEFALNMEGFLVMGDAQGNPLVPTVVRFRTAKAGETTFGLRKRTGKARLSMMSGGFFMLD